MTHTFQSEAHEDFINSKGFYSIIMQAVCVYKCIFRDIKFSWPGRVHDARVLANSDIFNKGETNTLFPNRSKKTATTRKGNLSPYCTHRRPGISLEILAPQAIFQQRSAISCAAGFQLLA